MTIWQGDSRGDGGGESCSQCWWLAQLKLLLKSKVSFLILKFNFLIYCLIFSYCQRSGIFISQGFDICPFWNLILLRLLMHFYCKEVTKDEFLKIEKVRLLPFRKNTLNLSQRVTQETCDPKDIWSESWSGDMVLTNQWWWWWWSYSSGHWTAFAVCNVLRCMRMTLNTMYLPERPGCKGIWCWNPWTHAGSTLH